MQDLTAEKEKEEVEKRIPPSIVCESKDFETDIFPLPRPTMSSPDTLFSLILKSVIFCSG